MTAAPEIYQPPGHDESAPTRRSGVGALAFQGGDRRTRPRARPKNGGVDDRDGHTRMMDALIAQWREDGVWPPKGPENTETPPTPEGGRRRGV